MEEKESQLTAVSLEREELKSKLTRLQSLVTTYMKRGAWNDAESAQTATGAVQGTIEFRLCALSLYPHLALACGFLTMRRDFGLSKCPSETFSNVACHKKKKKVVRYVMTRLCCRRLTQSCCNFLRGDAAT